MKVAVVTHYYAPHVGGIETVAREQAHRLAERGWEVHVFTSRLRGDDDLEQDGAVVVHRYRALNWFESAFRVPVPVPSPRMMVDLRAAGANVFLVHGHTCASSFYAAAAARLTKTPLVLLQHSPWVDYPQPLAALEYVADHTLGRFLFTTARQTICVSEHTARYVNSISATTKIEVIYSGVDTTRFCPTPPRACPQRVRVTTLRRLVPRQGVDTLVRAWMFSGLGAVADLVIGGTGPEERSLQSLAEEDKSIRFTGRVDEGDLVEFYQNTDLFVLPSTSGEGFGLVAAEALASGRPVLATMAGGPAELVRNREDGLLVAAGDMEALAEGLVELVLNHELRVRLSKAAARRTLGWGHSIDELELVLHSAAKR